MSLASEVRLKTEAMINRLKDHLSVKPRTYRKVAHKRYLSQSKKKNPSRLALRKTMRDLLNCVERNLGHIDEMLDQMDGYTFPLLHKYQRKLGVVRTLYGQQRQIYQPATAGATTKL